MALPVQDSPTSKSKSYAIPKDRNIHNLTPRQKAVHQQTVVRHLSNRRLPGISTPELQGSNGIDNKTSKTVNVNVKSKSKDKSNWDWDEKSYQSQSHSVIKDLPDFPKEQKEKTGIKKNKSAPSLSTLQQEKLETGIYLHHTAIPRSLSATFANYQPDQALSLLMDLPMEAYMGVGGGNIKSLLQNALKKVNEDIDKMDHENYTDEEEEDLRIDSSVNRSQAIPTAPDAIPPSAAIEQDLSSNKDGQIGHGIDDDLINGSGGEHLQEEPRGDIPKVDSRAHAASVKHDIEQTLQQGYTRNLVIAVLQALIGAFLYGWNVAILNVPQPTLQESDVTNMTDTEYGLINTMFCAGGLIGALCAGPLQDRIGRKMAMLCVDVVFLISAAITYFFAIGALGPIDKVGGYVILWIGRFIVGVACGAATAVVPTYLGEISPPLIRGAIGTSNQLTICFGVVIVEIVGYKALLGGKNTWQYLFIGNALPIIQLLTVWSFPESPKWLVQQGRDSDARKALQKLRQTMDVRVDMMLMKGGVLHEENAFHSPHVSPKMKRNRNLKKRSKQAGMSEEPLLNDDGIEQDIEVGVDGDRHYAVNANSEGIGSVNQNPTRVNDDVLSNRNNDIGPFGMQKDMWTAVKWATIIAIVLMFMQQFSGINAVFFYSATILHNAGLTNDLEVWLGSLGISIANFFAVFIAVFSIDRAGRKVLLILSCIIMGSASILTSIAIELESDGHFWSYASIGFLVLFVVGFEVGLGAIPWLMMAELAPMQYRGAIVAIATASNWGSNLLIAQFTGPVVNNLYFYPFAVVCGLGMLFTMKKIPETNGKTAAEIQKELSNM